MESSSCTRPHFQGRAWPPRPPPAARDPPSHSLSSAIVVVPAMPPPGHPAATAPPSRCRSPRRSSSCSRLTRGPCCRSRPLEGRPRPCSAAMFAQPLPLLLLLLPSLLLATVAQRGAKRWWTRNARNGALHNTVSGAASLPGGGRSSSLPTISSAGRAARSGRWWMRNARNGALYGMVPGVTNLMRARHPHLPDARTSAPPADIPTSVQA